MSDLVKSALEVLEAQLNQPLQAALEVCARCGICAEACHYYRAEPALEHVPAFRGEQLRRAYRAEHDLLSRVFPRWTGARTLDEATLGKMAEMAFSTCTLCRRCTFNCPLGVDTPLMMRAIRAMATATGTAPEILVMLADAAIEQGKDPEMYRELFLDNITDLEGQLRELMNDPHARIPVEEKGAKILYVPLAGAHSILPPAVIFNAARESWTLSLFQASNYGIFLGDVERAKAIAKRIVDEAKRLEVQEIVLAECGHAYTVYRWEAPNWFGPDYTFRIRSIVEVIAEYVADGRLRLDPTANPDPITYHDSCNLARSGGLIEEPRAVLRAAAMEVREMTPNREQAFCCGGGGGLVAVPEYEEKRLRAGRPKAEQIRQTGARVVVAACENCRLQMGDLATHYGLGVEISSLADLVVKAMRLPGAAAHAAAAGRHARAADEAVLIPT
ncbi:MAG: (Fe-S)-binding protein [Armatimonadota bacterium]|nr:(Fe-S)-binding protein [Armatimonadota bacterium]